MRVLAPARVPGGTRRDLSLEVGLLRISCRQPLDVPPDVLGYLGQCDVLVISPFIEGLEVVGLVLWQGGDLEIGIASQSQVSAMMGMTRVPSFTRRSSAPLNSTFVQ